jgi:hypothetical protein
VVAHHTGVAKNIMEPDFPGRSFELWADPEMISRLDEWTAQQVSSRAEVSVKELLDEWSEYSKVLMSMMRGQEAWPEGAPPFAERVVTTDLAAHEQDIYGALGVVAQRESPAVKIGLSSYIGGLGFKFQSLGAPALGFDCGDRQWVAGEGEPAATVKTSRWELFRALSGRRAPEQIRALEWDGDPEPFVRFFYPYSPRTDALVE